MRVAIIGVGWAGFRPSTPHVSYKELMFEAAQRAYADANIDPRTEVHSFVCCTEDFWQGNSIADEYMPDQLGAVLRPLCTIAGDGLLGVATAWMQIQSGLADLVVVEAHSKLSEVHTPEAILQFAYDPIWTRVLHPPPLFLAGLEMRRYLQETGNRRDGCAAVVVKNRKHALRNPDASYPAALEPADVLASPFVAEPLTEAEVSSSADGAIVCVIASERRAKEAQSPIYIGGIGWSTADPWVEDRDYSTAEYAALSARQAYRRAGLGSPARAVDLAEIDDTFAYKELQHLEALGLCPRGRAAALTLNGVTDRDGQVPVNVSGGALGVGHMVDATGLQRLLFAVLQLRGQAGLQQLSGVGRAVVQSWRGLPTASGAVTVLSAE